MVLCLNILKFPPAETTGMYAMYKWKERKGDMTVRLDLNLLKKMVSVLEGAY